LNKPRKFLVVPSKKRPWYYVETSKVTITFFIENLLTSKYKLFNAFIRLLSKFIALDKLLAFIGHETDKIEESITSAVRLINLNNNNIIIRLTTWHRKNDKFTLFIFNGKQQTPHAIAKCLPNQFSHSLENEFANMKKITGYFKNTEISVPHPIKLIKSGTHSIYLELFCEGIALNDLANREFSPNQRLTLYEQGLNFVDNLIQKFAMFKSKMHQEIFELYIESSLENFEKTNRLVELYLHRFNKLKDTTVKMNNKNIASIPMHGDLWGGSILMNGNEAAVIDWEFFQDAGMPLWDLFMFFIHPGFVLKGHNKGLFSEFRTFSRHKNVLNKMNHILNKRGAELDLEIEDIEFLFQIFLIYNCLTRDNSTEKNWETCLNNYWASEPLWVEN